MIFEDVVKASDALKAAFKGDLCDRHIGLREKVEGAIGAEGIDVVVKGH